MHAKLDESQQKSRALRNKLVVKERELELARKTIGRLSNERTLIQVNIAVSLSRCCGSNEPACQPTLRW